MPPATAAAVALLSAATLAYEILLVRAFAIEHFHHFAFMAIGVAMLGFGVSGTALALVRHLEPVRAQKWFIRSALLAAASLVLSPTLLHRIPLDATQIAIAPRELPWLAAAYLVAAFPFALGAAAVLLTLTIHREHLGRLYGASFIGSGFGATLALGTLWLMTPERALAVPSVIGALGGLLATERTRRHTTIVAGLLLLAVAGVCTTWPPWTFRITPYKELPQVEAFPNAERVAEYTSPVGWVTAVQAPAFRYAPGLSLAYRGAFPTQTALFVDGQIAGAAADWTGDTTAAALFDWLPTAAPYAVLYPRRVLVLGSGGGTEVWNVVVHGASSVTAVELQPDLVRLSRTRTSVPPAWTGREIVWRSGDARSFVSRTRDRFDLVSLAPGGGFGPAAGGVHALNEDFLHTVDAYGEYLELLNEGGVVAVTTWLRTPPRESVRIVLTAAAALRRFDERAVDRGLIVLRSWGTVTVLVRPSGFDSSAIATLERWAGDRHFDLDWHPDLTAPTPRFNMIEQPVLFEAARAATGGRSAVRAFAENYPFAVAPVGDARPYPHHFLRTNTLVRFVTTSPGEWLPFAEWGYLTLVATLFQSALLAGLLMIVPVALRRGAVSGRGRLVVYFTAIGLAYMTAEIAAIQQLGLLLGHPVYAVAVVLTAMLVCSGIGSTWSDRLATHAGRRSLIALTVVMLLYAGVLLEVVHLFQPAPLAARAAVAAVFLAAPALIMGMPFPVGLRVLAGDGSRTAWAWAANGFASVVAAPLAALLALEAGSGAMFVLAGGGYAAAAVALYTSKAGPSTSPIHH